MDDVFDSIAFSKNQQVMGSTGGKEDSHSTIENSKYDFSDYKKARKCSKKDLKREVKSRNGFISPESTISKPPRTGEKVKRSKI